MRRSFVLFTGFLLVIGGLLILTGGEGKRLAPPPVGNGVEREVRVEPKINVAPVLVKPRSGSWEGSRLNPEWLNAVVMVRAKVEGVGRGAKETIWQGSGILAGTPRTVLTWLPDGVIEWAEVLLRDGSLRTGTVAGRDKATGIAVVTLDEAASMALDWRDGAELRVGDSVHALGFESGVGAIRGQVALESSGALVPFMLDRNVPDAWVGGAVVDGDGRVAGVLLPKDRARMGVGAPVLGGQELMWTVDSLVQGLPVRRIDLGLSLGPRVSVPDGGRGWKIVGVDPGGLADEAGVKAGDILIAVNEREIAHPGQLRYAAGAGLKGGSLVLELDSGGVRRTILLPGVAL